jgi:Ras-related GTP-binding protein C/D
MHSSAYVKGPQLSDTFKPLIYTSTIIPLEIWDCPGNITVETLGAPLSQFATMIFVIDIRVRRVIADYICGSQPPTKDLYHQPIAKLSDFIAAAYQENPNMSLEVFVHKAEKLQEDDKIGTS